jgi:ATP-dependent Clp endopeptidase proteolytic subunit ClpP
MRKKQKAWFRNVEHFTANGIHPEKSLIYVGSVPSDADEGSEAGVDFQLAERTVKGLILLAERGQPITMILNNIGGDIYHGMAIYDAVKACPVPVNIIVYGQAMSMGSLILQAGTKRLLQPNSTLLLHEGTEGYMGHARDFERMGKEAKRTRKLMTKIYQERSGLSEKKIKKLLRFDSWISAEEAVKLGLADGIATELP